MPADDAAPAPVAGRIRRPTRTATFGSGRRESHDASDFYARFTAPEISADDHVTPPAKLDQIVLGDARALLATDEHVADGSVALMVTSPPYFAGKEYEAAMGTGHIPASYVEYLEMLRDVFAACARKLEPGGRMAVNVANLGRKPYRSLAADVVTILQDDLRLLLRGEIIWQKAVGAGGSLAWGSFQQPANPVLRDLTERVIVASKGRFDRAVDREERRRQGLPHVATISVDRFMESTTDVWEIPPQSATRAGHPAPFPVELPAALIDLYTYAGDLVLDPFMGSGSTAVAAVLGGRHYMGCDTDAAYVTAARARVSAVVPQGPPEVTVASAPVAVETPWEQARREGKRAKQVARLLVEGAGFAAVEPDSKVPGGAIADFALTTRRGGHLVLDVCDAFTSLRAGHRRTDAVWKLIGKAALLDGSGRTRPRYVVLFTEAPPRGSAAWRALTDAHRAGVVHAAFVLDDPATAAALHALAAGGDLPTGVGLLDSSRRPQGR